MKYEFPKADKKVARKVIETGLQRDYEKSIQEMDTIIQDWKLNKLGNQEAYLKLYKTMIKNDKYIGRMYNDLRGSTYMLTILGLLSNNVLTEADLKDFSEKTRQDILRIRQSLGLDGE